MKPKVVIVGAGWAGLSAAVVLAQHHVDVTVLEAAPHVGGRARGFLYKGQKVDNGQHILLGAYHHTLFILNTVGVRIEDVFNRYPFRLYMKNATSILDLKLNSLPPPLNLIIALIFSQGLTSQQKKSALKLARILSSIHFELLEDRSVKDFLIECGQPNSLIDNLWGPLALAALTTPIEIASSQVFLKVLKDTFNQENHASNVLLPKTDLSELFCNPVLTFLKQHQVQVYQNQRVHTLLLNQGKAIGVQAEGVRRENMEFLADAVILATPFETTASLLRPHAELNPISHTLQHLSHQPIITVYLCFNSRVILTFPMMGILQGVGHWVIERSTASDASDEHILSVVISGYGIHTSIDNATLCDIVMDELSRILPSLPPLQQYKIIREKRAAFSCEVGVNRFRPSHNTPIQNLTLAGDYTKTGYPSTLEGAVKSGIKAAELSQAIVKSKVELE